MSYLNPEALDGGLDWVDTNGTTLHICSSEPANFGAVSSASLGSASVNVPAPSAATGGRKVTVPAVTGGTVSTNGTASHWAITDGTSVLVATGSLSASKAVTTDSGFNTTAFDITYNNPV